MTSPPYVPRKRPTSSSELSIWRVEMAWTTASMSGAVLITADTGPAGPQWKAIVSKLVPTVVGRLAAAPKRNSLRSKVWSDQ